MSDGKDKMVWDLDEIIPTPLPPPIGKLYYMDFNSILEERKKKIEKILKRINE